MSTDTTYLIETFVKDMEASLHEKVKVILPWLPTNQRVVDVGTGVGLLASEIATTRKDLDVVGIDSSPLMISEARSRHPKAKNLEYKEGDACEHLGVNGHTLIYSSIMHEVYSYNSDSIDKVLRALKLAYRSIPEGGRIIVTDFVAPSDGSKTVELLHMREDMKPGHTLLDMVNSFVDKRRPACYTVLEETKHAVRYLTDLRTAYEFMFRKDFNGRWEYELNEKYAFWTGKQARELLEIAGFHLVHFSEFKNKWIEDNRLKDKIFLHNPTMMGHIDYPNYKLLMVGEKK